MPVIAYAVMCIFWAGVNAQAIKADVYINHWANFLLHFVCCLMGFNWHPLIGIAMVFEGRVLFDTALNLFRGLPVGYVPEDPASVFDRVEKAVFGMDGITPKIIYAALAVAFLLIKAIIL